MNLKAKFFLISAATTLVVALSLLATGKYSQFDAENHASAQLMSDHMALWRKILTNQNRQMEFSLRAFTRNRPALEAIKNSNSTALYQSVVTAFRRLNASNIITKLKITDQHGRVLISLPHPIKQDNKLPMAVTALDQGKILKGIVRDIDEEIVLATTSPLYLGSGEKIGSIFIARNLQDALLENLEADNSHNFILEADGEVLYATSQKLYDELEIPLSTNGKMRFETVSADDRTYQAMTHSLKDFYGNAIALMVSVLDITTAYEHRSFNQKMSAFLNLTVVALSLVFLNWFMSRSFQTNLKEVQDAKDMLEQHVEARTYQLKRANNQLEAEITERRSAESTITRLAYYDSLTELPNRTKFQNLLENIIGDSHEGGSFGLLLMDLDNFREINDTLGHSNGDLIIQEVALRLRTVHQDGVIARLGGDEFAIVMQNISNENETITKAKRILSELETPFSLGALTLDIRISIGISIYPHHGKTSSGLLQSADVAMYLAKQHHSGFNIYNAKYDLYNPQRLSLMGQLRQAIGNSELRLFFQPKVCLKSNEIRGAEALIRWDHPQYGILSPARFIPLAEQTGIIRPLTYWVIDQALAHMRTWIDGGNDLQISVNLSTRNLLDNNLPMRIKELLNEHRVNPEHLSLEITESAIMEDPEKALDTLIQLDEMNIELSIDDFGTGYSSLAYIRKLPVKEIKIDRSFVMDMDRDDNDAVIVRSTIDLAHNLGLKVVAEGIEDQNTLELLVNLGCNLGQGFHIGTPMPARDFEKWLVSSPWSKKHESQISA